MRKKIQWVLMFLLSLTLVSPIHGAPKHKVAFYAFDKTYQEHMYEFYREYVSKMYENSSHSFELISCIGTACTNMLDMKEVDYVVGMPYDQVKTKQYTFTEMEQFNIGINVYVPKEKEEVYSSRLLFNSSSRIGIIQDSVISEKYQLLSKMNNYNATLYYYDSLDEMIDAVHDNHIDGFAYSYLPKDYDYSIFTSVYKASGYFASLKEYHSKYEDLYTKEMNKEDYDLLFDQYILKKESNESLYNQEELDYLASSPIITYTIHPSLCPIEQVKKGEPEGISIEFLKYMEEKTGIKFQYVPTSSYQEAIELFQKGQVQMISGETYFLQTLIGNDSTCSGYFPLPIHLYLNKDTEEVSRKTIGLPIYYEAFFDILKHAYPNVDYIFYDTIEDCLQAVNTHAVDWTAINSYIGNELMTLGNYENVVESEDTLSSSELAFAFSSTNKKMLVSIFDKTISCLSENQKKDLPLHNLAIHAHNANYSMLEVIKNDATFQRNLFIFSIVAIIVAVAIWYFKARKLNKKLSQLAYEDFITGYGNINYFKKTCEILKNKAYEGMKYAMIGIEIGRIQNMNIMLGTVQGDQLLTKVSDILNDTLTVNEVFGRISKDQFMVFKQFIDDENLQSFMTIVEEKIGEYLQDSSIHSKLNMCFGIYLVVDFSESVDSMIEKSIVALQYIPMGKLERFRYYDDELNEQLQVESHLETLMEDALVQNEFYAEIQPKYNTFLKKIIGGEALVRWNSKEGIMNPNEFIPLFEKNGFVKNIDLMVLDYICFIIELQMKNDMEVVPISFNLSRVHFNNLNLVDQVYDICLKHNVPTKYIEIELTETAFFEDTDGIIEIMNRFKKKGFRLALDDFGTGYSSLNILTELPLDVVKIDKSFISGELEETKQVVLKKIVELANSLEMEVICEGVETQEQADYLHSIGCDNIQGYLFSKPVEAVDFEKLIVETNK